MEAKVDYAKCPKISQDEQTWLQRPFSEAEVPQIIKQSAIDKVPRPDGFTMRFFKTCWDTIKDAIMQTIHNFHQNEYFEKSLNATFINLVPKKYGAEELRDYRPISLIGGVYMIISKLSTKTLKIVMGKTCQ